MNIDRIKKQSPARKISYFELIDSTNHYLLTQGDCGEVCISDEQSAGRGRRGNTWVSPNTGNLYFSLCWCFEEKPVHWSLLGLVVGIAIADALEDIGLTGHGIKWPNDIFWQQRKMGGILIEAPDQSGKVVIGIGLNINLPEKIQAQIDQDVTTLTEALSNGALSHGVLPASAFSRDDLLISLVKHLYQELTAFENLNFDDFIQKWGGWDILRGKTVSINHQGENIIGEVTGIDTSGRLEFKKSASGEVFYFSSAEIKLKL